jgi:hypothetical protein
MMPTRKSIDELAKVLGEVVGIAWGFGESRIKQSPRDSTTKSFDDLSILPSIAKSNQIEINAKKF